MSPLAGSLACIWEDSEPGDTAGREGGTHPLCLCFVTCFLRRACGEGLPGPVEETSQLEGVLAVAPAWEGGGLETDGDRGWGRVEVFRLHNRQDILVTEQVAGRSGKGLGSVLGDGWLCHSRCGTQKGGGLGSQTRGGGRRGGRSPRPGTPCVSARPQRLPAPSDSQLHASTVPVAPSPQTRARHGALSDQRAVARGLGSGGLYRNFF